MSIVESHRQGRAPLKALGVRKVGGVGVLSQNRYREWTGGLCVVLVELQGAGEDRVEASDGRTDAKGGTNQAVGTRAHAAGSDRRAAGAGANCSTETAHAAAGGVLHDAGVDAENVGARLGAQIVSVGDVQVVAGDVDIEIVLERERDGVVDRKINLAVVHERVDARRIAQVRLRYFLRAVGLQKMRKGRAGPGIILQMNRLRLGRKRRGLRCGGGGDLLSA